VVRNKQVRRDYLAWTPAEKDPKEDGVVVIPQHGIAGHQDLVDNVRLRGPSSSKAESSAPATPPPEREPEPPKATLPVVEEKAAGSAQ
jgi:Amt family ammonium transporter